MGRRRKAVGAVRGLLVGVIVASGLVWVAVPTSAASDPAEVRAVLNGKPIALADVSRYHCHDRAYPLIRCFRASADRDLDELTRATPEGSAALSAVGTPYVRWYADKNLGGSSFDAYVSYSNLGDIGWNDAISSFSTYPGGHARWSQDIGFGGMRWDWGSASISYVGDAANDKFSSVERL